MIKSNSHKTAFDIRIPHDPQGKCNTFITKVYSLCECLLNIRIKVIISLALSVGIIFVILSQIEPNVLWEDIKNSIINPNISTHSSSIQKLLNGNSH